MSRLVGKELIDAYRNYASSPLLDHIAAIEDELEASVVGLNEAQAKVEALEQETRMLRARNGPRVDGRAPNREPLSVTRAAPLSVPLSMPLTLTAEEIIQYTVEVEVYDV